MLPSSFGPDGSASERQHFACLVVDDKIAFDAGSLAFACSDEQRRQVRDVVLSHTHLDHIAGLPLFIDDLFSTLTAPVRVHGTSKMIDSLRSDVFNGSIYPPFHEFENETGKVLEFVEYDFGREFVVAGISVKPIEVNHSGPSAGFVVSDGKTAIGITGDTAETSAIWKAFSDAEVSIVLVECAFPDEMAGLATDAHHMTPNVLADELRKLSDLTAHIYVTNIKPMYRERVVAQIEKLGISDLEILRVGKVYES